MTDWSPDISLNTYWENDWKPEFVGTLMFIVSNDEILLINKKTGHGAGKINGPGGKLHEGERVVACAIRETEEETGLTPLNARCVLEMRFVERKGPQWLGFACLASGYRGDLIETDEADPFWCPLTEIPYAQMWPDDSIWLPRILGRSEGDPLVADFLFEDGQLLDSAWRNESSIACRI